MAKRPRLRQKPMQNNVTKHIHKHIQVSQYVCTSLRNGGEWGALSSSGQSTNKHFEIPHLKTSRSSSWPKTGWRPWSASMARRWCKATMPNNSSTNKALVHVKTREIDGWWLPSNLKYNDNKEVELYLLWYALSFLKVFAMVSHGINYHWIEDWISSRMKS